MALIQCQDCSEIHQFLQQSLVEVISNSKLKSINLSHKLFSQKTSIKIQYIMHEENIE